MSIGARRSCLRKKSGEDKARDALFLTKSSSYGTRSQEEFLPSENADLANLATIWSSVVENRTGDSYTA